ncbi:hypothetical protein COW36_24895 [bacterium (Candidatus Blackallbacteria) CG17_big_fil_post_rev_8_21_14_2_50_48_46]|uniref:Uncharacterized protein n=1 Tax=bacterium (Candidatus Blackallbacteria) CG17_big_fil_post_rev_8_21_14_2_50_48_46 TaxID=2014261 RepID=A0A2M7FWS6_9BACT|nr:MAG: hypothetical protein COW64_07895 [bacterium (Candidatus Blackallbacteria) CG18_big_fil_WC_8_21_14_2_50_49_26]PIW13642.1 MAG: hypothetical protein COW36_24895 [bacterium (Candidatus Blackallbacteria) CG17_big_fil_post_rev_8_21_14_2_50_48_46]PIW49164.1 MAG: hypothetical protein COW20_06720 [bacterium (Candidatus Blackallbacteria) CG13_big_fil_rev_8_21_14_2_50_49_14]
MNPYTYYITCQVMMASLKAIAEAFIRSSFDPDSIPQSAVTSMQQQESTLFQQGMALYNFIYSSGAAPRYNPIYLNGLYGFLNQGMNGHLVSGELYNYRIRAKDLNKAHELMVSIMQTEGMINSYRDPFNMGYPPLLSSVNQILAEENIEVPPHGGVSSIESGLTSPLQQETE